MRPIRRNSKEFRKALDTATEVHRCTLATNWKPVACTIEEVKGCLEDRAYTLEKADDGTYRVSHKDLPVEYRLIHNAPAAPRADDSEKD